MSTDPSAKARTYLLAGIGCLGLSFLVWVGLDLSRWTTTTYAVFYFLFPGVALAQFVLGVLALISSLQACKKERGTLWLAVAGVFLSLGALLGVYAGFITWALPYMGGFALGSAAAGSGPSLRG